MTYKRGKQLFEGKTKIGFSVEDKPDLVWFQSKNDITKNDDKTLTEKMTSKAEYSTNTTSRVFEFLREAGIPVAFEEQVSGTGFIAKKCEMIPLEVICRRIADGSYLKRNPQFDPKFKNNSESMQLHRFHRLVFELFLKTTDGKIVGHNGVHLDDISVDDPFIKDPYGDVWELYHPKLPVWDESANLKKEYLNRADSPILHRGVYLSKIEEIERKIFLLLEGAWAHLGYRLGDFKLEFGIILDENHNIKLVVADVIDNDSWRLHTHDGKELSKQLFRDNYSMKDISDAYNLVSEMVKRFSIPRQVIVFWRGSDKDKFPEVPKVTGVDVVEITMSGHKSTHACLNELESVLMKYPQGGVIITPVGMSNGLGPILASHTNWPVISYPASEEMWQQIDIFSSLRAPSQVPLMTVMSPKNAVLEALDILAQKNPAAYMERQYAIEMLDGGY